MSLVQKLRTAQGALAKFSSAAGQAGTAASRAAGSVSKFQSSAGQVNTAVNRATGSVSKFKTSAGQLSGSLGQATTSSGKAKTSTDKLKSSLDKLKTSGAGAKTALRDVKTQADAVEKSVGKAGKSAGGSGKSMSGFGKGLKGATLAQKGLNTAMKANAFGLIMSLLAPLIGQFINMDKVSKGLAKAVKWAWNAISGAIKSHAGPIKSVMKGLVNSFTALPRAYISGINAMIGGLNRIHVKIPGWVPGVGGKEFGVHIPTLPNIPTLAAGGVVPARAGGRLALIGEGGEPEAVIPLSKLSRMLAAHPGGGASSHRLAAAVEKLSERPVHVEVDSQVIARAVLVGQRQLARR